MQVCNGVLSYYIDVVRVFLRTKCLTCEDVYSQRDETLYTSFAAWCAVPTTYAVFKRVLTAWGFQYDEATQRRIGVRLKLWYDDYQPYDGYSVVDRGASKQATTLHPSYRTWCRAKRVEPLDLVDFAIALAELEAAT